MARLASLAMALGLMLGLASAATDRPLDHFQVYRDANQQPDVVSAASLVDDFSGPDGPDGAVGLQLADTEIFTNIAAQGDEHVERVENLAAQVGAGHDASKSMRAQAAEEERQMLKLQERISELLSSSSASLVPPGLGPQERQQQQEGPPQPYEAALRSGAASFLERSSSTSFVERGSSFHAERAQHLTRRAKEAKRHSAKLHRARKHAEAQLDARHRLLLLARGRGPSVKGASVLAGGVAAPEDELNLMLTANVGSSLARSRAKIAALKRSATSCEKAEEAARKDLLRAAGAHAAATLLAKDVEVNKGSAALAANVPYQTAARTAKTLDEDAAAAVDAKAAACAATAAEPPKGLSALA